MTVFSSKQVMPMEEDEKGAQGNAFRKVNVVSCCQLKSLLILLKASVFLFLLKVSALLFLKHFYAI